MDLAYPIYSLFKVPLIEYSGTVTNETEQEIRLILEAKGLGDFKVPEHLLVTNE